ncbi:MAG: hypothetical protein M0033_02860 [Nitrospiraceae bacterium]|nr:hypothetical protein [Nitrospiraceae bacterium]
MPRSILVFIEIPADEIIKVSGQPVTFKCRTEPAGYEDRVTWLVPGQQHASKVTGKGRVFTTVFSSTGVKQIVASGPAGEYTEVTIDRRLITPVPRPEISGHRREETERERDTGWTGPRPLPPKRPPEEPPPPYDVVIEDVIQSAPDVDDVVLYVYQPTKEASVPDILDSDPPPADHRRGYTRSPKRGGGRVSW